MPTPAHRDGVPYSLSAPVHSLDSRPFSGPSPRTPLPPDSLSPPLVPSLSSEVASHPPEVGSLGLRVPILFLTKPLGCRLSTKIALRPPVVQVTVLEEWLPPRSPGGIQGKGDSISHSAENLWTQVTGAV